MFVISPDHWPFRGGASDWVSVVSNCTMGRMWTHFPTQLRVGIVTKEAIASPKQYHGAICHSTDPVIRAPLKCPYTDTLLGIFFHTKYGVMALMHGYVRQANFASKPLL